MVYGKSLGMRKVQHYHRHSQLRVIAMIGHYATSWSSVIGDCCLFGYRPYVAIMNTKSMGLCTKGYPPEHGSDTETNVMDNRDFAIFVFKMSSGRIYYIAQRPTPPGSWWRHQMETFSALLALCVGNSPVTGKFPTQRPATRSLMFSLICAWIKGWVNNREDGDSKRHRAHYDVNVMFTPIRSSKYNAIKRFQPNSISYEFIRNLH